MVKQKLGRGLAALTSTAVLATPAAAADDEAGAAVRIEQLRQEHAARAWGGESGGRPERSAALEVKPAYCAGFFEPSPNSSDSVVAALQ